MKCVYFAPCICDGVETRDAEMDGLRRHAFELEEAIGTVRPALKWIRDHVPDPDPHSLAGSKRWPRPENRRR